MGVNRVIACLVQPDPFAVKRIVSPATVAIEDMARESRPDSVQSNPVERC